MEASKVSEFLAEIEESEEQGKKAELFAKLQRGTARKRINAT